MASDPATFAERVATLVREHQHLAEPLVFAFGFAEGIPGLSLLVPSSALFLGIGGLQAATGASFWPLWLAASAGAVIGDCVTYALGRLCKERAPTVWPLSRYPGWLPRGRRQFEHWGILTIVGGKFLGFMRPFLPVVAGVLEMPLWQFLPASLISSLAWAGAFLAPGFGLGRLLGW